MQYENAKDILPASLLEEVQKFAEGKAIYIPKRTKREGWGEASGYRGKLNKRNSAILSRYSAGQYSNAGLGKGGQCGGRKLQRSSSYYFI